MPDFMVMVPGPTINIPEVINCQHHLDPALMGSPDWLPRLSAQIEKRLKTAKNSNAQIKDSSSIDFELSKLCTFLCYAYQKV